MQRPYQRESSRAYSKDSVVVFISKYPVKMVFYYMLRVPW